MVDVDNVDKKILTILKNESRRSFVDIGKDVNLSEPAVRRRIKKLVENGIIKRFTIETDVGNGASAITLLSINPSIPTPKISSKLLTMSGIDVVYEITGQYDIAVIVSGSNIANINKCIDEIRQIEGVVNSNTVIILKTMR